MTGRWGEEEKHESASAEDDPKRFSERMPGIGVFSCSSTVAQSRTRPHQTKCIVIRVHAHA